MLHFTDIKQQKHERIFSLLKLLAHKSHYTVLQGTILFHRKTISSSYTLNRHFIYQEGIHLRTAF